ncbi:hypothetical protein NK6_8863 [Bradyrhizobium diazoefficiens]|uniref:DUF7831 domain-containing protein n=1 Tax=Bradyrhizobium diazoefficiens TaxID=1355477 RepID=A0A0E4BWW2_9BRAD|nr:hypothetical protein NK6_8863 [Bradyrhizobium diazoefficiens]
MPLFYQDWITREDLRANPDKVYVFGDNVERRGYAGQAKEMRGEPNAIGVVTKWAPSMDSKAYFDDTDACRMLVERDLLVVQQALDRGRAVVVPADGIGPGLSRLPKYAPNLASK